MDNYRVSRVASENGRPGRRKAKSVSGNTIEPFDEPGGHFRRNPYGTRQFWPMSSLPLAPDAPHRGLRGACSWAKIASVAATG
jgi:hypothetical protein